MPSSVNAACGRIEGEDLGGVQVFRGVPYAFPPVGERRFRAPEKMDAWTDVRACRVFRHSAPQNQPMLPFVQRLIGASFGQSEDCLYLNIWTPAADGKRRPVMVWIHGGAFVLGSGATGLYSGARLAERGDVVVVTINYRLGALGFLNTNGILGNAIPANLGLRDQIAALEWVRDHIEAFGGDPECVTVFGESAGAMSIGALLGSPRADGLFSRAILQSGASHNVSTPEQATRVARRFLSTLGPHGVGPTTLRSAPLSALLRAQRDVTARLDIALGFLPWQPSVDGDVLPRLPITAMADGWSRSVPTIIGTNRDEWRLFLLGDPRVRSLDEAALERRFKRALVALLGSSDGMLANALQTYGPSLGTPVERWCAFQSDRVFHAPAALLAAERTRAGAAVHAYRFDWSPPFFGSLTGAFHGIEVPFVFGTVHGGVMRATVGLSTEARRLSSRMQRAWIEFARSGDPRHEKLPEWPAYETERRPALILGPHTRVEENAFATALGFFAPLLTQLSGSPDDSAGERRIVVASS